MSNSGSEEEQLTVYVCKKPACKDKRFNSTELQEHREFHRKERSERKEKEKIQKKKPKPASKQVF